MSGEMNLLKQEDENIDIISGLHESVLVRILSFLCPRQAVQTSALSKIWIDLWRCMPSLNLERESHEDEAWFERFVFSILLLRRTSQLDRFRLYSWTEKAEGHCIPDAWIRYAVEHKPRVISVHFEGGQLAIPASLFRCDSLEKLTLAVYANLAMNLLPPSVDFPRMKRLVFQDVTFGGGVLEKILSRCPLVEILCIQYCNGNILKISSDELRVLCLEKNVISKGIDIATPHLESLDLIGDFSNGIRILNNLPSLAQACLMFANLGSDILSILKQVSNARQLELRGPVVQGIVTGGGLPRFSRLAKLKLDSFLKKTEFNVEELLRRNFPNLEMVIFSKQDYLAYSDDVDDGDNDGFNYDYDYYGDDY